MKRPPRLDPEPAKRRKRALSREELALWESVARQVKPLRRRAAKLKAEPDPETADIAAPVTPARKPERRADSIVPKTIPVLPAHPPLVALGRRERSHLARGRKEIEARLDLHGMTQSRAHRALFNFLARCSGDGMTFVLVITGKGRASNADPERGVLRRQVPHWLGLPEFRSLVVGFEEAHIGHGGEGALYVRVRRGR
ncbi:Smr/MutS family protein [Afipia sp. TerB]